MARPSTYTEAEDAIILATAGETSVETNRLLVESGFRQRTANAITQRRFRLMSDAKRAENAPADIPALLARRARLARQMVELEQRQRKVEEEMEQVGRLLLAEMEKAQLELAEELGR